MLQPPLESVNRLAVQGGAHPRAGGENATTTVGMRRAGGSSPRGRGKPPPEGGRRWPGGLIPARAGKTTIRRARRRYREAHPRAGGENVGDGEAAHRARGSSPRGRGKRRGHAPSDSPSGLIPARAGKTEADEAAQLRRQAHPRAGGENLIGVAADLSAQGSSPRGRGKPRV